MQSIQNTHTTNLIMLILLFVYLIVSINGATNEKDYVAVKNLFESTDGKNWIQNKGWTGDENPCCMGGGDSEGNCIAWYGLTCMMCGQIPACEQAHDKRYHSHQRIIGIDLSGSFIPTIVDRHGKTIPQEVRHVHVKEKEWGNNLVGVLPHQIFEIEYIRVINLGRNGDKLTGNLRFTKGSLQHLISLNLNNCGFDNKTKEKRVRGAIGDIIPAEIGELKSLENIYFGCNSFKGFIPDSLGRLGNLVNVDLNGNHLVNRIPYELTNLNKLQSLLIHDNTYESDDADGNKGGAPSLCNDFNPPNCVAPCGPSSFCSAENFNCHVGFNRNEECGRKCVNAGDSICATHCYPTCENVDNCTHPIVRTCSGHGICNHSDKSYECTCAYGYRGNDCENCVPGFEEKEVGGETLCVDKDECVTKCLHAQEDVSQYITQEACESVDGAKWVGFNVNPCGGGKCTQTSDGCTASIGEAFCACGDEEDSSSIFAVVGMGERCEIKKHIDNYECKEAQRLQVGNWWGSHDCDSRDSCMCNTGTCYYSGDYRCDCQYPYENDHGESTSSCVLMDKCKDVNCGIGGNCSLNESDRRCTCLDGYHYDNDKKTCVMIKYCDRKIHCENDPKQSKLCLPCVDELKPVEDDEYDENEIYSQCINHVGGFSCVCNGNYGFKQGEFGHSTYLIPLTQEIKVSDQVCSKCEPGKFKTTSAENADLYEFCERIPGEDDSCKFTFHNCGKTGYEGPTIDDCIIRGEGYVLAESLPSEHWIHKDIFYDISVPGYQVWTVPATAEYKIEAYGAGDIWTECRTRTKLNGVDTNHKCPREAKRVKGKGAHIEAHFKLTRGTKIVILVGQMGTIGAMTENGGLNGHNAGGGSGGTFVLLANTKTPREMSLRSTLLVAGGAGGSGYGSEHDQGCLLFNGSPRFIKITPALYDWIKNLEINGLMYSSDGDEMELTAKMNPECHPKDESDTWCRNLNQVNCEKSVECEWYAKYNLSAKQRCIGAVDRCILQTSESMCNDVQTCRWETYPFKDNTMLYLVNYANPNNGPEGGNGGVTVESLYTSSLGGGKTRVTNRVLTEITVEDSGEGYAAGNITFECAEGEPNCCVEYPEAYYFVDCILPTRPPGQDIPNSWRVISNYACSAPNSGAQVSMGKSEENTVAQCKTKCQQMSSQGCNCFSYKGTECTLLKNCTPNECSPLAGTDTYYLRNGTDDNTQSQHICIATEGCYGSESCTSITDSAICDGADECFWIKSDTVQLSSCENTGNNVQGEWKAPVCIGEEKCMGDGDCTSKMDESSCNDTDHCSWKTLVLNRTTGPANSSDKNIMGNCANDSKGTWRSGECVSADGTHIWSSRPNMKPCTTFDAKTGVGTWRSTGSISRVVITKGGNCQYTPVPKLLGGSGADLFLHMANGRKEILPSGGAGGAGIIENGFSNKRIELYPVGYSVAAFSNSGVSSIIIKRSYNSGPPAEWETGNKLYTSTGLFLGIVESIGSEIRCYTTVSVEDPQYADNAAKCSNDGACLLQNCVLGVEISFDENIACTSDDNSPKCASGKTIETCVEISSCKWESKYAECVGGTCESLSNNLVYNVDISEQSNFPAGGGKSFKDGAIGGNVTFSLGGFGGGGNGGRNAGGGGGGWIGGDFGYSGENSSGSVHITDNRGGKGGTSFIATNLEDNGEDGDLGKIEYIKHTVHPSNHDGHGKVVISFRDSSRGYVDGTCSDCPDGKFTKYLGSESCIAHSEHIGEDCVIIPGTTSTDAICGKCKEGEKFWPLTNSEGENYKYTRGLCLPCEAGKYNEGGNNSRECIPCAEGKYTEDTSQAECKICPAGSYTTENFTKCDECVAGKFSPFGKECITCDQGKYSEYAGSENCTLCSLSKYTTEAQNSKTPPVACNQCSEGSVVDERLGATSCTPCPIGTFSNDPLDIQCKLCEAGKYTDTLESTKCIQCPAGTYRPSGDSASKHDNIDDCIICPAGKYNILVGQFVHTSCIKCDAGKSLANINTAEAHDEVSDCVVCDPGKYQNIRGGSLCINCPRARYNDKMGGRIATDDAGPPMNSLPQYQKYVDIQNTSENDIRDEMTDDGISTSQQDAFFKDGEQTGDTSQYQKYLKMQNDTEDNIRVMMTNDGIPLVRHNAFFTGKPEGSYHLYHDSESACEYCPRGTFQDQEGQTSINSCTVCPAGTYNPGSSAGISVDKCLECPDGSFNPDKTNAEKHTDRSNCIVCGPGKYWDSTNDQPKVSESSCQTCATGRYNDDPGGSADGSLETFHDHYSDCKICPPGYWKDIDGQKSSDDCIGCPAGTYLPETPIGSRCELDNNEKKDKDCEDGSPTDVEISNKSNGIDDCIVCPSGRYSHKAHSAPDRVYTCHTETVDGEETEVCQWEGMCIGCDAGKHNPSVHPVAENRRILNCEVCDPGKYQEIVGSTDCKLCDKGKYISDEDTAENHASSSDCLLCPNGRYSEIKGIIAPGTSTTPGDNVNSSCKMCSNGQYIWGEGAIACIQTPKLLSFTGLLRNDSTTTLGFEIESFKRDEDRTWLQTPRIVVTEDDCESFSNAAAGPKPINVTKTKVEENSSVMSYGTVDVTFSASCKGRYIACAKHVTETTCQKHSCSWSQEVCSGDPIDCSKHEIKDDCKNHSCSWEDAMVDSTSYNICYSNTNGCIGPSYMDDFRPGTIVKDGNKELCIGPESDFDDGDDLSELGENKGGYAFLSGYGWGKCLDDHEPSNLESCKNDCLKLPNCNAIAYKNHSPFCCYLYEDKCDNPKDHTLHQIYSMYIKKGKEPPQIRECNRHMEQESCEDSKNNCSWRGDHSYLPVPFVIGSSSLAASVIPDKCTVPGKVAKKQIECDVCGGDTTLYVIDDTSKGKTNVTVSGSSMKLQVNEMVYDSKGNEIGRLSEVENLSCKNSSDCAQHITAYACIRAECSWEADITFHDGIKVDLEEFDELYSLSIYQTGVKYDSHNKKVLTVSGEDATNAYNIAMKIYTADKYLVGQIVKINYNEITLLLDVPADLQLNSGDELYMTFQVSLTGFCQKISAPFWIDGENAIPTQILSSFGTIVIKAPDVGGTDSGTPLMKYKIVYDYSECQGHGCAHNDVKDEKNDSKEKCEEYGSHCDWQVFEKHCADLKEGEYNKECPRPAEYKLIVLTDMLFKHNILVQVVAINSMGKSSPTQSLLIKDIKPPDPVNYFRKRTDEGDKEDVFVSILQKNGIYFRMFDCDEGSSYPCWNVALPADTPKEFLVIMFECPAFNGGRQISKFGFDVSATVDEVREAYKVEGEGDDLSLSTQLVSVFDCKEGDKFVRLYRLREPNRYNVKVRAANGDTSLDWSAWSPTKVFEFCGPGEYFSNDGCMLCSPGRYNEVDYQLPECHICPEGNFCASTGQIQYAPCDGIGDYCPANTSDKDSWCPDGFYCEAGKDKYPCDPPYHHTCMVDNKNIAAAASCVIVDGCYSQTCINKEDQSSCDETDLCTWNSDTEVCIPVINCSSNTDQSSCSDTENCLWVNAGEKLLSDRVDFKSCQTASEITHEHGTWHGPICVLAEGCYKKNIDAVCQGKLKSKCTDNCEWSTGNTFVLHSRPNETSCTTVDQDTGKVGIWGGTWKGDACLINGSGNLEHVTAGNIESCVAQNGKWHGPVCVSLQGCFGKRTCPQNCANSDETSCKDNDLCEWNAGTETCEATPECTSRCTTEDSEASCEGKVGCTWTDENSMLLHSRDELSCSVPDETTGKVGTWQHGEMCLIIGGCYGNGSCTSEIMEGPCGSNPNGCTWIQDSSEILSDRTKADCADTKGTDQKQGAWKQISWDGNKICVSYLEVHNIFNKNHEDDIRIIPTSDCNTGNSEQHLGFANTETSCLWPDNYEKYTKRDNTYILEKSPAWTQTLHDERPRGRCVEIFSGEDVTHTRRNYLYCDYQCVGKNNALCNPIISKTTCMSEANCEWYENLAMWIEEELALYCPERISEPLICMVGHYCANSMNKQRCDDNGIYCPRGTRNPLPCPSGNYCMLSTTAESCVWDSGHSNMEFQREYLKSKEHSYFCPAGSKFPDPCGKGYYCEEGETKTSCDEEGETFAWHCPITVEGGIPNPLKCKAGFECETSASEQTPCGLYNGKASYCPEGTKEKLICPKGYYCETPKTKTKCMLGAPEGTSFICYPGSTNRVECPAGKECTNGETEKDCGEGYYCEFGKVPKPCDHTYTTHNEPGNPSWYCPSGTKVPTKCPKSFYCIRGGKKKYPCDPPYHHSCTINEENISGRDSCVISEGCFGEGKCDKYNSKGSCFSECLPAEKPKSNDVKFIQYENSATTAITEGIGTTSNELYTWVLGHTTGNINGKAITGVQDIVIIQYSSSDDVQKNKLIGEDGYRYEASVIKNTPNTNDVVLIYQKFQSNTYAGTFIHIYDTDDEVDSSFQISITSQKDSLRELVPVAMAVEDTGNIYALVLFGTEYWIVKYNPAGIQLFAPSELGNWEPHSASLRDIGLDSSGNLWGTGFVDPTTADTSFQKTTTNDLEIMLMQINPKTGNRESVFFHRENSDDTKSSGESIAFDSSDHIWVGGTKTVSDISVATITKFSSNGEVRLQQYNISSDSKNVKGLNVSIDSNSIYLAGTTEGNLKGQKQNIPDADISTLSETASNMNLFVSKFDNDANHQDTYVLVVDGINSEMLENTDISLSSCNLWYVGSRNANVEIAGNNNTRDSDLFVWKNSDICCGGMNNAICENVASCTWSNCEWKINGDKLLETVSNMQDCLTKDGDTGEFGTWHGNICVIKEGCYGESNCVQNNQGDCNDNDACSWIVANTSIMISRKSEKECSIPDSDGKVGDWVSKWQGSACIRNEEAISASNSKACHDLNGTWYGPVCVAEEGCFGASGCNENTTTGACNEEQGCIWYSKNSKLLRLRTTKNDCENNSSGQNGNWREVYDDTTTLRGICIVVEGCYGPGDCRNLEIETTCDANQSCNWIHAYSEFSYGQDSEQCATLNEGGKTFHWKDVSWDGNDLCLEFVDGEYKIKAEPNPEQCNGEFMLVGRADTQEKCHWHGKWSAAFDATRPRQLGRCLLRSTGADVTSTRPNVYECEKGCKGNSTCYEITNRQKCGDTSGCDWTEDAYTFTQLGRWVEDEDAFFCPSGTAEPLVCSAGKYCASSAKEKQCLVVDDCHTTKTCTYCPEGSRRPVICPAGSYCDTTVEPKSCVWDSTVSDPKLEKEEYKYFCPEGSVKPDYCPERYYCPNANTTELCLEGYYCPERLGLQSCVTGSDETSYLCPAGSNLPSICPVAFYCELGKYKYPCDPPFDHYCFIGEKNIAAVAVCVAVEGCYGTGECSDKTQENTCNLTEQCSWTAAGTTLLERESFKTCETPNDTGNVGTWYGPFCISAEGCFGGNECRQYTESSTCIDDTANACYWVNANSILLSDRVGETDCISVNATTKEFGVWTKLDVCILENSFVSLLSRDTRTSCIAETDGKVGIWRGYADDDILCPEDHWIEGRSLTETNALYCGGGVGSPGPCTEGYYCPNSGEEIPCGDEKKIDRGNGDYCPEGSNEILQCPPGKYCPSPATAYDCLWDETVEARGKAPRAAQLKHLREKKFGYFCPGNNYKPLDCPEGYYCPDGIHKYACDISCTVEGYDVFKEGICLNQTTGERVPGVIKEGNCEGHIWHNKRSTEVECKASSNGVVGTWYDNGMDIDKGYICEALSKELRICPIGFVCPTSATPTDCLGIKSENESFYCPVGSKEISICLEGYYCNSTRTSQMSCMWDDKTQDSVLQDKTFSWYCPTGTMLRSACPAGVVCNDAWNITDCPKSYYCALGQHPKLCGIGKECPEGSTEEKPCPAGSFCNYFGTNLETRFCDGNHIDHSEGSQIWDLYKDKDGQSQFIKRYDTEVEANTALKEIINNYVEDGSAKLCTIGSAVQSFCPKGHYCEDAEEAVECDDGFYCPEGTRLQRKCDAMYRCSKSYRPKERCNWVSGSGTVGTAKVRAESDTGFISSEFCPTGTYAELQCEEGWNCAAWDGQNPHSPVCICVEGCYGPDACRDINTKDKCINDCTWVNPRSEELPRDTKELCETSDGQDDGKFGTWETGRIPCEAGFYCPQGELPKSCKTSSNKAQLCLKGSIRSNLCPKGYYCEEEIYAFSCDERCVNPLGSGNAYNKLEYKTEAECIEARSTNEWMTLDKCKANSKCNTFYCDYGSSVPIYCPLGYECPNSATREKCDDTGWYCPEGTTNKSKCPAGYYCPTSSTKFSCIWDNESQDNNLKSEKHSWLCLEGSVTPLPCPAGRECSASVRNQICTAGYYCCEGFFPQSCVFDANDADNFPRICAYDENNPDHSKGKEESWYCEEGSIDPQKCPEGYYCENGMSKYSCDYPFHGCMLGTKNERAVNVDIDTCINENDKDKVLTSLGYCFFPAGLTVMNYKPFGRRYGVDVDGLPATAASDLPFRIDGNTRYVFKSEVHFEDAISENLVVTSRDNKDNCVAKGIWVTLDGTEKCIDPLTEISHLPRRSKDECTLVGTWQSKSRSNPRTKDECFMKVWDPAAENRVPLGTFYEAIETKEECESTEFAAWSDEKYDTVDPIVDKGGVHHGTSYRCTQGSHSAHLCPAGYFCETSVEETLCEGIGVFCGPKVNPAVVTKKIIRGGWYTSSMCPKGYYCMNPAMKTACQEQEFCDSGQITPLACPRWGDIKLVTGDVIGGVRDRCECPANYYAHLGGNNIYWAPDGECQGKSLENPDACPSTEEFQLKYTLEYFNSKYFEFGDDCGGKRPVGVTHGSRSFAEEHNCNAMDILTMESLPVEILMGTDTWSQKCLPCPRGAKCDRPGVALQTREAIRRIHITPCEDENGICKRKCKYHALGSESKIEGTTWLYDCPMDEMDDTEKEAFLSEGKYPLGPRSDLPEFGYWQDPELLKLHPDYFCAKDITSSCNDDPCNKCACYPTVAPDPESSSRTFVECTLRRCFAPQVCEAGALRNNTETGEMYETNWQNCRKGHEGIMCAICKKGYVLQADGVHCEKCEGKEHLDSKGNKDAMYLLLGIVGFLAYVFTVIFVMSKPDQGYYHDEFAQKMKRMKRKMKNASRRALLLSRMQHAMTETTEYSVQDVEKIMTVKRRATKALEKVQTLKSQVITRKGQDKLMRKLHRAATRPGGRAAHKDLKKRKRLHSHDDKKDRKAQMFQEWIATIKICASFMQVMSQLKRTTGEKMPRKFISFCDTLDLVNFDMATFATWLEPCTFSTDYATKFYGHFSFVPVFTIVLFFALQTANLIRKCCGKRAKFTYQSIKMNGTRILLLVIFCLYPGLSVKCFRVFNCMEVNGRSYLMADLAVRCDDEGYNRLYWTACAGVGTYVIGIPLFGFFLLRRRRMWLIPEDEMGDEMYDAMMSQPELREQHYRLTQQYGSLFLSYRHGIWWYEFIEMMRKAMMTGMLAALPKGIPRAAVAVVVSCFFLGITAVVKPYRFTGDFALQLVLLFTVCMSFYAFLLLEGNAFVRAHENDNVGYALIGLLSWCMFQGAITIINKFPPIRMTYGPKQRAFLNKLAAKWNNRPSLTNLQQKLHEHEENLKRLKRHEEERKLIEEKRKSMKSDSSDSGSSSSGSSSSSDGNENGPDEQIL